MEKIKNFIRWENSTELEKLCVSLGSFKEELQSVKDKFYKEFWETLTEEEKKSCVLQGKSWRLVNTYRTSQGGVTVSLDCQTYTASMMLLEEYGEFLEVARC